MHAKIYIFEHSESLRVCVSSANLIRPEQEGIVGEVLWFQDFPRINVIYFYFL